VYVCILDKMKDMGCLTLYIKIVTIVTASQNRLKLGVDTGRQYGRMGARLTQCNKVVPLVVASQKRRYNYAER
jgi:hypothetical protein